MIEGIAWVRRHSGDSVSDSRKWLLKAAVLLVAWGTVILPLMKWRYICGLAILGLLGSLAALAQSGGGTVGSDWRTASRASIGIAPDPAVHPEPIIQVYAARAVGWRGRFGVHSWIAAKPANAIAFDVYEVIGWRSYNSLPAISVSNRPADGRWFGNTPELLADVRGDGVEEMILRLRTAVEAYPRGDTYTIWPGPNSNTFVAHLARALPELRLDLPPTAIGKDFIPDSLIAATPSGTGYQLSLFGLLGILVAVEEGLEINILGLTFGIDPLDLALKLPFVGRLGPNGG